MSRWRAIVFDLDDTLYPERDFVLSGFRAVAEWAQVELGIASDLGFEELKRLFEQGTRGDTFDRWLAAHGLSADGLVAQLLRVYREHEPALVPFPETPGLLHSLGQRLRLGLLSDGYLAVQQRKWAALNLADYFDAVVFSDEWGREAWKPSPKPYEVVLQRLELAPGQAIYVGDNPLKDFIGARQVGMATIRIRRPGGEYAHLEPPTAQHAAHLDIDCLSKLEEALPQLEDLT